MLFVKYFLEPEVVSDVLYKSNTNRHDNAYVKAYQ